MRLAIKQEGQDVANMIRSEAKKESIFLKNVAKNLGLPLHKFHREIKKDTIQVEFIRIVLTAIKPGLKIVFYEELNGETNYNIIR